MPTNFQNISKNISTNRYIVITNFDNTNDNHSGQMPVNSSRWNFTIFDVWYKYLTVSLLLLSIIRQNSWMTSMHQFPNYHLWKVERTNWLLIKVSRKRTTWLAQKASAFAVGVKLHLVTHRPSIEEVAFKISLPSGWRGSSVKFTWWHTIWQVTPTQLDDAVPVYAPQLVSFARWKTPVKKHPQNPVHIKRGQNKKKKDCHLQLGDIACQ